MVKRIPVVALAALLAVAGLQVGCSSNGGSNGGSGSVNTANVDLAVGDLGAAQVALYFDILGFFPTTSAGHPTPDVVLDNSGSGIQNPSYVTFAGTDHQDLVVCDADFLNLITNGADTVSIFRDYQSLTDGDAPNVVFTNGGALAVTNPNICEYNETEDVLAFTNFGTNEVVLIYDFSSIPDGTDPAVTAVTLDSATSLLTQPSTVFMTESDLWVANSSATGSAPCVTGYRDIATLANADAPDVVLSTDVSFFSLPFSPLTCTTAAVAENPTDGNDTPTLYVTTGEGEVFVFADVDNLASDALPDAVLLPGPSQLEIPATVEVIGDRLFVPNLTLAGTSPILGCGNSPAMSIFESVGSLFDGQAPSATVVEEVATVSNIFDITKGGGALFATGLSNCNEIPGINGTSNVVIYRDPSNMNVLTPPDILIPGSTTVATDLFFPIAVAARAVDIGT